MKYTRGEWRQFAPRINGITEENYRTITGGDKNEWNTIDELGSGGFEITGYIKKEDSILMSKANKMYEALKYLIEGLNESKILISSTEMSGDLTKDHLTENLLEIETLLKEIES